MGESGGSAERLAASLTASGSTEAGAWAAGAEGERRVASALGVLASPWVVVHDRLLRPGLSESNLDHVAVGPSGIYLVDAKNWAGDVSAWDGGLFQHRRTSTGARASESKHAELMKVLGMAGEMATRLGQPVVPVLCLAGARAERFGEPQYLRGVWVVPVTRIAEWIASRPSIVAVVDLPRTVTLVMTEFPSTTTDRELLAAIGADLARGRQARPRAAHSAHPGTRPSTRARRSGAGRATKRRRPLRLLLAVLLFAGLMWALMSGALVRATSALGTVAAEQLTKAFVPATPPVAATTSTPSCGDFDPAGAKALRGTRLEANAVPLGCEWYMTTDDGHRVLALKLVGFSTVAERLDPMLTKGRRAGVAETRAIATVQGAATVMWSPAGFPLTSAKGAPPMTRSVTVQVSHEALGISAKTGRSLARSMVTSASGD